MGKGGSGCGGVQLMVDTAHRLEYVRLDDIDGVQCLPSRSSARDAALRDCVMGCNRSRALSQNVQSGGAAPQSLRRHK